MRCARHEETAPIFGDDAPGFAAMWPPNDFFCTGTPYDWNVIARVPEIAAPTLIACGSYDMCSPALDCTIADGIPDNDYAIFGNASRLTWLEDEASAYPASAATRGDS